MSNDVLPDRPYSGTQDAPVPCWRRPRIWLCARYVLAGFPLVPGLVRSQATSWVKTNLDKSLALGQIKFNPLTFTLDVSDVSIPGDGGGPIVAVGHLRVSFAIQ